MHMHPLNPMRFFSSQAYEDADHLTLTRARLFSDTAFTVATSALAWLTASSLDRTAPQFAAALRCVPALAFAVWLIRRISGQVDGYQLEPQVDPVPVSRPRRFNFWNWLPRRRGAWPSSLHSLPVDRQPSRGLGAWNWLPRTRDTGTNALHPLPETRSFPPGSFAPPAFPSVVPSRPGGLRIEPPMNPLPRTRSSFPSVNFVPPTFSRPIISPPSRPMTNPQLFPLATNRD